MRIPPMGRWLGWTQNHPHPPKLLCVYKIAIIEMNFGPQIQINIY